MKKSLVVLTISTICAGHLMGAENLEEMFKEGKFGGYVRIHHIEPSMSKTIAATGSVIGGKLKYQTGAWGGLRLGTAMYTTHDTGLTKNSYKTKDGYSQVAQGLHGDEMDGYTTLGEAYINYRLSNTDVTLGRQEFATPMTQNAVTIIPNLFEGGVAKIKEIPDFTFTLAHIDKMQYGTRAATDAGLIGDVAYAITAGAGYGFISPTVNGTTGEVTAGYGKEKFQKMSNAAFGKKMDSKGVSIAGMQYKKGPLELNLWDYYAHKQYNTIYADGSYKMDVGGAKITLGAQILKQDDISGFKDSAGADRLKELVNVSFPKYSPPKRYSTKISEDGSIDALVWGLEAKAQIDAWSFNVGYNDSKDGHVINAWGGDPLYTSTIFSRNGYRADTTAYKVGGEYDFSSLGIKGLKFSINHARYSSDVETWINATKKGNIREEKSHETDYMLFYAVPSVKGLWFRLFHVDRKNDTREYDQKHTRLIANLSF